MDCNVSFINQIRFGGAIKLLTLQFPRRLCCKEWAQAQVFATVALAEAQGSAPALSLRAQLPGKQNVTVKKGRMSHVIQGTGKEVSLNLFSLQKFYKFCCKGLNCKLI